MITCKRCSEVSIDDVFETFNMGFSDYILKMNMNKEFFIKRFFGAEGNRLEHSFIAYDNCKPIGIVLGGIRNYEGMKTMRCGALAVIPEYRGRGVSIMLMEHHKNEALEQGCRRMFLEVIVGNDRAIKFYNKLGYEKIYDLYYYTLKDITLLGNKPVFNIEIKNIDFNELRAIRNSVKDVHINWQNDIEYIEMSEGQLTLGAFIENQLVGAVSINKNTRISLIYVETSLRNRGIGTNLLLKAAEELKLEYLTAGIPNNASIHCFFKHLGFQKDKLSQYEMYYLL